MTYVLPFPKSKIPKGGEFGNKILYDGTPRTNAHRGVDFSVAGGTPIKSATDGEVVMEKWSTVLGNVVVVKDPKGRFWGYCHMREASKLKLGDKVVAGETVVGKVGNTGSASRGAHLHFTCGPDDLSVFQGKVVDPIEVLDREIAKASKGATVAKDPVAAEAPKAAAPKTEPVAKAKEEPKSEAKYVTVKAGDTYWGYGEKFGVDHKEIQKLNKGKALVPGEKVRVK